MQQEPDFYQDSKRVTSIGRQMKGITDKLDLLQRLSMQIADCKAMLDLAEESGDETLNQELEDMIQRLATDLEETRVATLLNGKYDGYDAIMTLHAGAGGTEAQDWTEMLYRMYHMYADKREYAIRVLDVLEGDEAGLKVITFEVIGTNAYGYLKAEKGVHRLVRISPFDSNDRRHTSFASVEVLPKIEEKPEIEIRSEDLRIDTYRASGAGGQHINKTDSAVRITHIPTGIVTACQTERSQIQNKETAMQMLYSKLVERQENEELEKLAAIRGEMKRIEWGSQIRSYVFCPYTLVKDHRTGYEETDVQGVMNGDIQEFINAYLKKL